MKKLFTLSFLAILLVFQLQAQTPHAMKYQTVIRNNAGVALVSKLVAIKASILTTNTSGTTVYQEVHNIATNEFGIANLNIGEGTVQSGNFNNINWGGTSHFLKIEIDIDAGSNFVFMGTSQLLSVPYALYAEKSANAIDDHDKDSTNELQNLNIVGNQLQISKGNSVTISGIVDLDADPTNELQTISKNGDTILLSKNGGSILIPNEHTLSSTAIGTNRTINITGGTGTTFSIADNDNDSTNELQTITKVGNTITLDKNGGSFTDSDNQNLSISSISTQRTINISNGTGITLDVADKDNDSTNELQLLSYTNDTLYLSKGNFVKLPHGFDGQYSSLTGKPVGNNPGDMQYWNGTSWIMVPAGQPGQFLRFTSLNKPSWSGGTPSITTNPISLITTTSIVCGGNILNDSGSFVLERGVCWNTSSNPTIVNNKTSDGIGTGLFTSSIIGLTPGSTYYFRAYGTNYLGTAYGNEISSTLVPAIGQSYQGGIVAYILQSGDPGYNPIVQHGLIAAPADQSTGAQWGCNGESILGAHGYAIGTGNQNTIAIIAGCTDNGIAAKLCGDLVLNGYSDWYLPSSNELGKLYINMASIGGFNLYSSGYWSSSEDNSSNALFWNFNNSGYNFDLKSQFKSVRAVRDF